MAIFLIRFSFQQHHQQHSTKQQYQSELYTLPSLSSSICHRPTVHYVKCPLRICASFLSCYILVVVVFLCISCYYYTLLDTFNFRCLLFCFFSRLLFMFSFNSLPFTSPPTTHIIVPPLYRLLFSYLGNTFFLSINRTIT
jgi:hypothetical protein